VKRIYKGLLCLLLCAAVLCPSCTAYADTEELSVIDPAELDALMEDFIAEHEIDGGNISIGYCYTATGERWYYNRDEWYYAGSMYKVPLMMLMAEKVKSGEITKETEIKGMKLEEAEELILVHSNNEWAHVMRNYLGGDAVWRADSMKYSSMKAEEYDPDFMDYGYVNPVYVLDVFDTLRRSPEDYPGVHEKLLRASPGQYLRRNLNDEYEIAQKYGALEEFYHIGGIIYTPNPIVVTVMTEYLHYEDALMGDAAEMLVNYTLELDKRLEALIAAQEAQPQPTPTPEALPTPEVTPAAEPVVEKPEEGGVYDSLAKLAAYISLPCVLGALVLGIMQTVENIGAKSRRRSASRRRK